MVPKYSSTGGHEAVELAASAGLHLDPWQARILIDMCGEREDGRWAAREAAMIVPRQNGKGAVIEARELAGLFLFGERLIMHSSHQFKTTLESFIRVRAHIDNTDDLRRRVRFIRTSHGEEGIELMNGARLKFVARSTSSGRGFSGDCIILDEAYALVAKQMAALMPTLRARPNPQILYFSTPPLESAAFLAGLRKRGKAADPDDRLAYFEYGAGDEEIDLDDRDLWWATNPAMGIRIEEETMAAERRSLAETPDEFARECLGVWPPDVDGMWAVISEKNWRARLDPFSQIQGDEPVFAIDVTPNRDFCAIAAAGEREDGDVHVEIIEHRPSTAWVITRCKELKKAWPKAKFVLDAAGPAGSLLAGLAKVGIEPIKPTAREVGQGCGAFWDSVCGDAPDLWHLDDTALKIALAGAQQRPLGDAWAWARRATSVDICPLVAATLAVWGVHGDDGYLDVAANIW